MKRPRVFSPSSNDCFQESSVPRRLLFMACLATAFCIQGQRTEVRAYAVESPKADITGPTEGVPGDLIEIDFSGSVYDKMLLVVKPAKFADGRPTFKLAKDGLSAALASRAGTIFSIELMVSNSEGIARSEFTITIGPAQCPECPKCPDCPPCPDPVVPIPNPQPPPPAPQPAPPQPTDRFGLGVFLRSTVAANIPPEKRYLCTQISGNYNAVKVGVIANWNDAVAKLKAKNDATEGADKALWAKVFGPLGMQVSALVSNGTFNYKDPKQIAELLGAIADGFAGAVN
jgi:hypothetical protein